MPVTRYSLAKCASFHSCEIRRSSRLDAIANRQCGPQPRHRASSSKTCRRGSTAAPFAAKRIVGQKVTVEADAYMDGHDVLAVELLWKAADDKDWQRQPMAPMGNARWQGVFVPSRVGRWQFTVEAWLDEYATLCRSHPAEARGRRRYCGRACRDAPGARGGDRAQDLHSHGTGGHSFHSGEGRHRGKRRGVGLAGDRQGRRRVRRPRLRRAARTADARCRPPRGGLRELVRALPALADRRPCTPRHLRRRHRAPAAHPRHGLRRPLFSANSSDRRHRPQGP